MATPDQIRILIVENEGLVGCDLASTLSGLGFDVAALCRSGEEALQLADDLRPDIVLMDVHLAGPLDGIETARQLATRSSVAVIYLTASADPATVARARETHPFGYLLKPYKEDELRSTLEVAAARHREEQRRRRQERSFHQAFQSLADAVIAADMAGRIMFINPAAERLLGWKAAEAVDRMLNEVYVVNRTDGEIGPRVLAFDPSDTGPRTVKIVTRSGPVIAVQDRATSIRDEHGSPCGVVIAIRPEAAPLEPPAESDGAQVGTAAQNGSHAPLADIVESISDPLIALDSRWGFTYANSSAAKLFGRERTALIGQTLWDVLPPNVHASHYEPLAHAMLHREAVTREIFLEAMNCWFEARTYPFGSGLILLLKDITSRKLQAERSNRMDRLESLGLLARGFAHDFNNLLTVLLGNLALAEMRFQNQPDKTVEIQTAKQATLQAQSLVQQLLTFARGGAPIKRPVSLADLVRTFFHHHARVDRVNYLVEVQEDMPEVSADPSQLRRLIGNLVQNAEQAMPDGGEIIVRVEATDAADRFPHETVSESHGELAGITLTVKDNGGGILPEVLPHVFEPYFSTRKAQNATGLGLTVCESIAKAHGGSLSVQSQAGQGATVHFYLPVDSENEEADALAMGKAFEPPPIVNSRILVLEDDHLVRVLIVRNLESQGYEVVETVEGGETVARYQEAIAAGRPFDLVVLDLSIPNGMGGLRTIEKLRTVDPNVLAIVSSGYSDDPVMAQPAAYGFAAVLPKPYEPVELLRLVKSLLAGRTVKKNPS